MSKSCSLLMKRRGCIASLHSSTCKTTTPSRSSWTNTDPMWSFTARPSEDRMLSKRCVAVSPSTISERFRQTLILTSYSDNAEPGSSEEAECRRPGAALDPVSVV